jgi:hypothetical protein
MKNTVIKLSFFLLVVLLLGSCEDYLTVLPENNQSVYEFWRTREEVESVLGAGYVKLRDAQEMLFLLGEARGNGLFFQNEVTELQSEAQKVRRMDILATNELARWDKLYAVINMANSVIRFGPDVVQRDESFNENVMKSFLSEAYFQRSLAYFYLVRSWGRVPFVKIPYVDDEAGYALPASEPAEILQACVADLQMALESAKTHFPETNVDNPMNTKGRATRWAILALQADIQLWLGNYDAVIASCEEIINSNRVGLISKEMWFSNFFPGNSNESIFEIQYSYALGQTNSYISWFDTNTMYLISPYAQSLFSADDVRGLNGSYDSGAKLWKYIGINKSTKRNSSLQNDQNFIMYRLADIYLMEAEAYAMKATDTPGDPNLGKSLELLNAVRTRAGIEPSAGSSDRLGMIQLILQERQRELLAEGKNWFDILRVANRNIAGFRELALNEVLQVVSAGNQAMVRAKLADPNAWYLPVHFDELSVNSFLEQNPFYENLGN